ncbi:MAG: thioesterase DpgC [Gammaproteobacteria bacterium]|jgi:thioesterase DpgC
MTTLTSDLKAHQAQWQAAETAREDAGPRPGRSGEVDTKVQVGLAAARQSRLAFMRTHGAGVYGELTNGYKKSLRVKELAQAAAQAFPGLVPTDAQLAGEGALKLSDKDGLERDQGIFVYGVLDDPACGHHLIRSMLEPTQRALDLLETFRTEGVVNLPYARVERRDGAAWVYFKNPRYLNAEDEHTLEDVETCVDLAILDPGSEVCVWRGDAIDSGKYAGQHIYCTGINLTHLYQGGVSYLWYHTREFGFLNKVYRGIHMPDDPDDMGTEKLWLAGVDNFAIGGGCQYLLVTDYTVAASNAYMTLPARKEGIIPGAANLRLPRFVGDRIARQAIMNERRLDCDSPEGMLICDEICEPQAVSEAVTAVASRLTTSGVVSAAGNRRAFRIAQEPFELFRAYMASYALEQAECHFSTALIRNLENFWNAANRKT